ncbi:hypothetical protein [Scytonema sp. UIC 10036]|uniref:hypothetical protein n=1 Tax=Scytonema sp. UIC 10036 TaxID=2304196 RepID=UPI001A9B39F6|nr:hypothetical protein [Scytonema sp. UIC 10036]
MELLLRSVTLAPVQAYVVVFTNPDSPYAFQAWRRRDCNLGRSAIALQYSSCHRSHVHFQ